MLIPESVSAFVHDGGIRRAIRELIDLPEDKVLEGIDWDELPRFYRAQLAARQLQAEWGVFAMALWDIVWGGRLDHWKALEPDEQMAWTESCGGVHLASLTDNSDGGLWFGRVFTNGAYSFYAALAAAPSLGLRLKVSCESDSRSIVFSDLDAIIDEHDNWTTRLALPFDQGELDPTPFQAIAAEAVRIADEGIVQRRSTRGGVG